MIDPKYKNNWLKKKIKRAREHQIKAYQEINELVIKAREGRKIILLDGTELIEFVSCSYLGLDMDERVIQAASVNLEKCGVTFPAARTRIKVESFVILENLLNQIFSNAYSTVFSSLHLGHLGFLPLLGSGEMPSYPIKENGPLFILDKTVHSSIQINRALLEQFGQVIIVNFQQLPELEKHLKEAAHNRQTPILIADSIGSMGGVAPVTWLLEKAEYYEGYVYLDDAHGTSIHGENGCGYVLDCLNNVFPPRLALSSSLAKAFGAVGGIIVLPTKKDMEMMKQFAPTYVFGGPPPLSIIDSAIASARIHLSDEIKIFQKKLWVNVDYFDSLLPDQLINKNTFSPIRGIFIGDEVKAIEGATYLRQRGYAVTTAMYPTVAKGKSLLRVALSAAHEKDQIQDFCKMVREFFC